MNEMDKERMFKLPPISYISDSPTRICKANISPRLKSLSTPSKFVRFKSSLEFTDIIDEISTNTQHYSLVEKMVADSLLKMNQEETNGIIGRQEVTKIKQIISESTISEIRNRELPKKPCTAAIRKSQKSIQDKENVTESIIKALTSNKRPVKIKKSALTPSNMLNERQGKGTEVVKPCGYDPGFYRFKQLEQFQVTEEYLGLEHVPVELNVKAETILDIFKTSKTCVFVRCGRSDDDLYTARYVRGTGKSREGLCLLCGPPTWHKIKVSAYWYHMNLVHGISTVSGRYYPDPISSRINSNGIEEVKCGNCSNWIINESLVRNEVVNERIYWWKHAQKCFN